MKLVPTSNRKPINGIISHFFLQWTPLKNYRYFRVVALEYSLYAARYVVFFNVIHIFLIQRLMSILTILIYKLHFHKTSPLCYYHLSCLY